MQLFSHILSAEYLWFERLQSRPPSVAVWPDLRMQDCEKYAEDVPKMWSDFLAKLDNSSINADVAYKNSKGEPWNSSVVDILNHVILHSAYHRGQIATRMRSLGQTPAYTDFIHAVRQHHVK